MKVYDVNFIEKNIKNSRLEFKISGINCVYINSIRRSVSSYVKNWGIRRENVKITENTSEAYNNDYMTLRLSTFPIRYIPKDVKIEEFTITLDVTNDSPENMYVTSKHMKYYINGKLTDLDKDQLDILIITLAPRQKIKLNIEVSHGNYITTNRVSHKNCFMTYEELTPDSFFVSVESQCHLTEAEYLHMACEELVNTVSLVKNEFSKDNEFKYFIGDGDNQKFDITQTDCDSSILSLINYEMQTHKNVKASGFSKPDHLNTETKINAYFHDKSKWYETFVECIDIVVNNLKNIDTKITEGVNVMPDTSKPVKTKASKGK